MSASLISIFRRYLLLHYVPIRFLLATRTTLEWLLTFFLLVPAVVSFALVFAWKKSPDSELQFEVRCYLDIDVVWSRSSAQCRQPSRWRVWLLLSSIRFVLTLVDIVRTSKCIFSYHSPDFGHIDTVPSIITSISQNTPTITNTECSSWVPPSFRPFAKPFAQAFRLVQTTSWLKSLRPIGLTDRTTSTSTNESTSETNWETLP
jgi:hypothetical protein